MSSIAIHWFRQDLRLLDNPGFYEANQEASVLPIYILDSINPCENRLGGASQIWLHHTLSALNQTLNNNLSFYQGEPLQIIQKICLHYNVKKVFWNRCYEPWQIKRDIQIKQALEKMGIAVTSYNASLLWEPWTIKKQDGQPYRVFTPFYQKGCLGAFMPKKPIPKPQKMDLIKDEACSLALSELNLLPTASWHKKLENHWKMGEEAAHQTLENFINIGLPHYTEGRNFPSQPFVSKLSPYLHFGEISPHHIWHRLMELGIDPHTDRFCAELGWREFAYSLLYFNHDLPNQNLQSKFDRFPWRKAVDPLLLAWQKGKTGIPIIDAGMRELWETGYMHNRVRMIVASFLVKNLLIDWRHGQRWFWDCLVDADLANNAASWQWVAGCGADAAPYFRIFNPVTQSQKFDPDGKYIKKYVPELNQLPIPYVFSPWDAPKDYLKTFGIVLGQTYPEPIVDLKQSRQEALEALKQCTL